MNPNANANAPRGINLYKWDGTDYNPTPYQSPDDLKAAVEEAKGDDLNEADKELVTEAFERHGECNKELNSNNWTDEICINIYKYYMFDNNDPNSRPKDLDKHIKANLKVNGYHILGNDRVELNEANFVEKLADLTSDEFKRCMIDISGFMLNQLLLGENYETLEDVKNALGEKLENNDDKDNILEQFQKKIEQATNQSPYNVRSDKQRILLGDDENSTVVSFAANSVALKEALNDELKNEINNAIKYISEDCIKDKTLKLNFFSCNIVNDLDQNTSAQADQISLTKLTDKLNQVFNSDDVDTSELTNILIILNGNPGVITDKNKNNNNNEYLKNIALNIKDAIAGENGRLKLQIQIKMDKFMRGRVRQMANVYNSLSGGSKKRSRPNKRVKTKKAKAKATRKKQNNRLKKNKTLKKKNRRA